MSLDHEASDSPDHRHGMTIPEEWTGPFDKRFWDDRYAEHTRVWSGNPNPHLVRVVEALDPGVALDIGSGEGADAIWLARHSWRVTATDISSVALDRSAAAIAADGEVAARIEWKQADVLDWAPPERTFDLVSSQYSHFPSADLVPFVKRLAASVAPGGTLLVVAHEAHGHSAMGPDYFVAAAKLAELLEPTDWTIVEAGLQQHPSREGSDEVLVARRRI